MMLGGIGTVFGIAYFVLSTMEIEFTKPQQMALLIAGVSFGLTVASYGMLLIRRERLFYDIEVQKNLDIASEFLHYWEEFENVSKNSLDQEHRIYNKYSI